MRGGSAHTSAQERGAGEVFGVYQRVKPELRIPSRAVLFISLRCSCPTGLGERLSAMSVVPRLAVNSACVVG